MKNWKSIVVAGSICILLWGATFCGMRGSFQRYPLKVSFAYFCDDHFYNKLGINPVFNIIKSAEYGKMTLPRELAAIPENEALDYVRNELHIQTMDSLHPLTRKGSCVQEIEGQPNVVLIFMESMTADNLERKGNGAWLTPYLRGLRDSSIYFSNCFSAGIHTNNGIVGTHYGYVPNFAKAIMEVNASHYTGLPYYLQKDGYETMCFVTGNPQYDNMNSFWRENSITEIYSLYDYDASQAVNNYGVSDGYMFDWGLKKLNEKSQSGKPFFASFLTVSNHGPYVVPEAYVSRGEDSETQIVAYADDALRHFVEAAQQTEWGKHTLFVLVADHGAPLQSPYEMVLSYNRIPVFVFGNDLQPRVVDKTTSQIDIWETVLSLLGIPYENNCLGIDVLNEDRRYAFFVSNEHLGVSDGAYFYCYSINSQRECLYRVGSGENIIKQEPTLAADMREYGMKMLYVNLLSIENHWTEPKENEK